MTTNDTEIFQSFCRKYINKAVKEHFKDVTGDDDGSLSLDVPRQAIKRLCLHKDDDSILLTIAKLLMWWGEARGFFNEIIYGIPAANLHETVVFKPQIAIYWRESIEDARREDRYPARARYTVRWKGDYATKSDIDKIRVKINNIFNKPSVHKFWKGREKYSYRDKKKGYEFIITAKNETEAKEVINKLLEIQGDNPLDPKYLTKSVKEEIPTTTERIRVEGQLYEMPKGKPIAQVRFTHAEFKAHGMTRDILLTDNLGVKIPGGTGREGLPE